MSSFFGIFNRNGNPVAADIVTAMQEGISYWRPDARGVLHKGPIAFGHAMLWNTPESQGEQLPAIQDNYMITMDGRLDNRRELAEQLGLHHCPLEQLTDSACILAAYGKWGEDSPKHLLGDFAFVIWDAGNAKIFCARDHVGIKQLYFHLTDELFVCANDLKGLVVHPAVGQEVNQESVAAFLVDHQLISRESTFFKAVQKLQPGHSFTVTTDTVAQKKYWRLEDAPVIKSTNCAHHAEKLRHLLEQAVHDRMRSAYPVAAHLSGGLDSSAIAVIAARFLRKKGESLLAFNWLHQPAPEDPSNHAEWCNSTKVARIEAIEHQYVALDARDVYRYMAKRDLAYGHSAAFWYEYPVRESVQARGGRTLLSGWGGDELATYHGQAYYADLFSRGKIIRLVQELRRVAGGKNFRGLRRVCGVMYHNIFLAFVPGKLYCMMPKSRCLPRPYWQFIRKSMLPALERKIQAKNPAALQTRKTIRKHMLAYWQQGHLQSRIESWATAALPSRLEYSYPLLDKRIIEFVAGLPTECFVREGIGRYLFRSAVRELLPENIVWENAKREPNRVERLFTLVLDACTMHAEDKRIRSAQSDWIDTEALVRELRKEAGGIMDQQAVNRIRALETAVSLLLADPLNPEKSV